MRPLRCISSITVYIFIHIFVPAAIVPSKINGSNLMLALSDATTWLFQVKLLLGN